MGKNRGSNRLKTQIEPENDRRAGASAVVFHFPLKRLCLRQPSCGGVRLFSSGKVRIPIRAVEDLASVPESQPDSPTDADALDPEPRTVNQPQPPAASGSSARIADASSLSAGPHPIARTRYSICMRSARQSSGDSSCPGPTPTRPPSASAGQPLRWPGSCACAVPVR